MYVPTYPYRDERLAKCWLENLQSLIPSQGQVLSHVTLMLSALLVMSEGSVTMETLNVIPIVAKADPSQVQIRVSSFKFILHCLQES